MAAAIMAAKVSHKGIPKRRVASGAIAAASSPAQKGLYLVRGRRLEAEAAELPGGVGLGDSVEVEVELVLHCQGRSPLVAVGRRHEPVVLPAAKERAGGGGVGRVRGAKGAGRATGGMLQSCRRRTRGDQESNWNEERVPCGGNMIRGRAAT